jgi:hypothetical protein
MGYTPYKMKADNNDPMTKNYGAVAPGKMRAFGTKDSDMPDGVSTTPLEYAGGVGSSPAKGWFNKLVGGAKKLAGKALDPLGLKNKAQEMLGGGGNAKLEARVSALEAGAGGGGEAVPEAVPEASAAGVGDAVGGVGGVGGAGFAGAADPLEEATSAVAYKKKKTI